MEYTLNAQLKIILVGNDFFAVLCYHTSPRCSEAILTVCSAQVHTVRIASGLFCNVGKKSMTKSTFPLSLVLSAINVYGTAHL